MSTFLRVSIIDLDVSLLTCITHSHYTFTYFLLVLGLARIRISAIRIRIRVDWSYCSYIKLDKLSLNMFIQD